MMFFCSSVLSVLGLSQKRGSTLVPSSHPNSSATRFATDLSFHEQQAQCTSHRKMMKNATKYPTVSNYPATNSNGVRVSPCQPL